MFVINPTMNMPAIPKKNINSREKSECSFSLYFTSPTTHIIIAVKIRITKNAVKTVCNGEGILSTRNSLEIALIPSTAF